MNFTIVFVDLFALACLIVALAKDRAKTKLALVIALRSFIRILPAVGATIILIGLILSFVSKDQISGIIGEQAGLRGIFIVALLGTILHIPSIISFPLAASLLKGGASVTAVAVFITTLTMIGVVTLPLEIRELGKKFAVLRNILSFFIAILIGLIMGMLL
jgi:uncharacterized membrane protein YraQ (UPF0718 family)